MAEAFDIVIAGGGSAGSVLAARLSEDPATRVLLAEAGPNVAEGAVPDAIASPYPGRAQFNPHWFWTELVATMGEQASNQAAAPRPYEQPRLLGGGSSVNGIGANRGQPSDYDEWASLGARGWGWDGVLPYFRKLERDLDMAGALHGQDGPLPIRRIPRAQWCGFSRAVEASAAAFAMPPGADQNGPWEDGVFPTAINLDENLRRASTALAYLTPQVRRRPNLSIMTEAEVLRVVMQGRRAVGLALRRGGETHVVAGRRIILSCGAIGSPVLLMRSGIGPAAHLQARGIAVALAREGVGANLQEHPAIGLSAFLPPAARLQRGAHYHLQSLLRWSSGIDGAPGGDMHAAVSTRSGWHAVGWRIGTLYAWVNKSYAKGQLRLGVDPAGRPEIDFRMLSDPRDLVRLMAAFRLCHRILSAAAATGAVADIFPTSYSARIKRLMTPSRRNGMVMALAGPLMDASPRLRRRLLAHAIEGATPAATLAADDGLLEAHLRRTVGGVWHPCGTCRMGDAADPMAVTDPGGQVIGAEGLMVCDASLMPTIPCANLNIPVLMSAEKIADGLRA